MKHSDRHQPQSPGIDESAPKCGCGSHIVAPMRLALRWKTAHPFGSREAIERIVYYACADSLAEIISTLCVFGKPSVDAHMDHIEKYCHTKIRNYRHKVVHTKIHEYAHTYTHLHTHTHIRAYTLIHTHTHRYTHLYMHTHTPSHPPKEW
jgi:hypothetical protein